MPIVVLFFATHYAGTFTCIPTHIHTYSYKCIDSYSDNDDEEHDNDDDVANAKTNAAVEDR